MDHFLLNFDFRLNYLLNNLDLMENLIIIGINLRVELPILNSKLRKRVNNKSINIFNFFNKNMLGMFINNDLYNFVKYLYFRNKLNIYLFFKIYSLLVFNFERKLESLNFFFGIKFLFQNKFEFNNYVYFFFFKYVNFIKFTIIISNISLINFFEVGLKYSFYCFYAMNRSFIFLNNIDSTISLKQIYRRGSNYVIYNGSYFDNGSKMSDISFPINMFFEYDGVFLNIEGRVRKLNKVINFTKVIYTSANLYKYMCFYLRKKIKLFSFFYFYLVNLLKFVKIIKFN
jgi:hypothetical protein